ncbi:hypothetical protein, partial [Klebsiella pneumoniae]|uniref:hypothetical protein n=1 Tax=Klebsiella pneumoniae TaxID=573 RepID=UPI001C9E8707
KGEFLYKKQEKTRYKNLLRVVGLWVSPLSAVMKTDLWHSLRSWLLGGSFLATRVGFLPLTGWCS